MRDKGEGPIAVTLLKLEGLGKGRGSQVVMSTRIPRALGKIQIPRHQPESGVGTVLVS